MQDKDSNMTIKLGDFEIISLDRPSSTQPDARIHMAFVRYNGMMHSGKKSVLVFEIGRYEVSKDVQSGSVLYLPAGQKSLNCRVDTYGRRVKLDLIEASALEVKVEDKTERQSAVRD